MLTSAFSYGYGSSYQAGLVSGNQCIQIRVYGHVGCIQVRLTRYGYLEIEGDTGLKQKAMRRSFKMEHAQLIPSCNDIPCTYCNVVTGYLGHAHNEFGSSKRTGQNRQRLFDDGRQRDAF